MARHLPLLSISWPLVLVPGLLAQQPSPPTAAPQPFHVVTPLAQPELTPGVLQLLQLEGQFQQAVAQGGGKAFASWFADDAITLANGKAAVMGRSAIALQATWSPSDYQLTWTAEGAQMGASNDMGLTWGTWVGRSRLGDAHPLLTSGRYITAWKKLPSGEWKVALESSAEAPPTSSARP